VREIVDTGVELVRHIVRSQLPDCRAESVRPLGEGLDHVAYEVDGDLVVRFGHADRDGPCAPRIGREVALLGVVAGISPLAVPRPRFAVPERCCYGYDKLAGVPMLRLPPEVRARHSGTVAASLGELLGAMHGTPAAEVAHLVPTDVAPATEWLREAADLYADVAAHVPAAYDRVIRAFLDTAPPPDTGDPPVFSHNDLGIEHVLVDPDSGQVTGVIDWSDAALCDRAYDFGLLLRDLGPAALHAALARYARRDAYIHARAKFYARCALIEDFAYGLDSGRAEYAAKSRDALDRLFAPSAYSDPA
jgi:aminoglycoside phosphotransferase (APT) family kinase protein